MTMIATTKDSPISDLHILLVDDDNVFLDLMQALLQALGVSHITRADSGMDAFNKLSKIDRVVDVVLCDYTMAQGNGLQLLQAIRMGKIKFFRPDACFILLTASGEPKVVATAADLDVNAYLVKPVTPDKLRNTIAKARARMIRIDIPRYANVTIPSA
jgi:two-component system chemotaxis response regulator CheY